MNKGNLLSTAFGFAFGTYAGNQMCKNNIARLSKNEKVQVHLPSSTDDVKERVPKALGAAAKELVDERTIDIKTGKEKA